MHTVTCLFCCLGNFCIVVSHGDFVFSNLFREMLYFVAQFEAATVVYLLFVDNNIIAGNVQ